MALRPPGALRRARGGIKVLGICVVVTALAAFGSVQGSSAADAASAASAAAAPVLTASAASVTRGTPVTFTYATPSNFLSTTNWIGFYSGGSTPSTGPYGIWEYTQTGTTSPPPSGSSPVADGTDTFDTSSLAPGTYTVYLLYNNGYQIIGDPVTLQVTQPVVVPGTLTTSQTSATAGDQVSFNYTMPSADVESGNTIAWFAKGANPLTTTPLYAFNQAAAAASGTDTFDTTGLAGGSYDVYLLSQFQSVIAGPVTIAVTSNGPQLPSPGQLPGQPNLLVNGGAEMGNATQAATQATTVPGWTATGNLNEVQYDAAGANTLYDFANGSTQGWQAGSGANSVQAVRSFANGPNSCSPGPWCLAVSSQGNGAGSDAPPADASRIAYISPATPLDLSGAPGLITYINGYGGAPGATGYTATVTLYSGTNTLSTTTPVQANAWNKVTLNTSGWPYLNQVTEIAVDYHADGSTTPWTMQYQIGGIFTEFTGPEPPTFSSPGSADRGQNFFAGGAGGVSTGTQTIDVSNAEGQINQGNVAFNLGGWLGGTGSAADDASVTATFLDASGDTLGTATLGPVTPAMRDDTTEFLPEHAAGTLPKQTKTVQVTLKISGSQGYADNLSFTISSDAVPAPPLPALPAPETPAPAATSGNPNLIVNGGAEIGDGSFDGIASDTLPGWTVTGLMSEVQYGAADAYGIGGWPTPSTPGPADRGSNFFDGGDGDVSTATQTIDVSKAEGDINQGNVSYDLSGWLGGAGAVTDNATVTATFLDASGDTLGTATLGPVTPAMRDDTTELLPEDATGTLPEQTKSVKIVLTVNGANQGGHGQGYADNLSFTISSAAVPAPALPAQPAATVPHYDHVFLVMMENQDYADIIGNTAQAPYLNSLLSQGANLTSMYSLSHPSDENYTALAAGTMAGQLANTQDAENPVQQIGDLVSNAGGTWRTYMQSANGPCDLGSQDTYTIDDTPFHNFKDVADNQAVCQEHEQPLTQMAVDLKSAATTPNFSWFSANDCDDMEGCGITAGDTWLSQTLPEIFNSPAWTQQRSLLIITWDEDNAAQGQANLQNIPTIILGSQGTIQPGSVSSHRYTLYSLTRTIEAALNLPSLTANDYYADPVNDIWTTGT